MGLFKLESILWAGRVHRGRRGAQGSNTQVESTDELRAPRTVSVESYSTPVTEVLNHE